MLKSAIGYTQIEKKTDSLSDGDVLAVVQKEAKKRRDAIEEFERGGRPELAAKEKKELDVLVAVAAEDDSSQGDLRVEMIEGMKAAQWTVVHQNAQDEYIRQILEDLSKDDQGAGRMER